jgi:hypothetical protein
LLSKVEALGLPVQNGASSDFLEGEPKLVVVDIRVIKKIMELNLNILITCSSISNELGCFREENYYAA